MSERPSVPPPKEAGSFEPEEFAAVYDLVARASRLIHERRVEGLNVTGADDRAVAEKARGVTLADAFAPVWKLYEGDPRKYHSAVHRMTALAKLIKGSRLKEWVTVTADGVAVRKAVLAAAATMPLNDVCEFPIGDFLEEVIRRSS